MLTPSYNNLKSLLGDIMLDLDILSGDELGPSDASWQDVAGTLSCNMKVYARLLDRLRTDNTGGITFPSRNDI